MSRRVQLTIDYDRDLDQALSDKFGTVYGYRIVSQSLDARGANRGRRPRQNYTIEILEDENDRFSQYRETFQSLGPLPKKPIIIGAGPAGLFAALRLSEYGVPCRIFERGSRAHERMKFIARFWRYGEFNPEDNVCYGEGGAGLFSDGKLITRIKSPYVQYVMQRFVDFGAPEETAYLSNPHLGSNKIRGLINKITDHLKSKGCEVHYNTRVDELLVNENNEVEGVKTSKGESYESEHVILATGHSAKEIYAQLDSQGVAMRPKDFAVGVRIEHPRKMIDFAQYGKFSEDEKLGAARYRLSFFDKKTQRGTYSFCMCPGGYVLSSGTDADGIVVNGMSNYARNSPWSNAALVVAVKSGEDFIADSDNVLGGLALQESMEKKAYQLSVEHANGKEIPAQRVVDFIANKKSSTLPKTSAPSKIFSANLREIFPPNIVEHLIVALEEFEKKMPGFLGDQALLLAPETRTSAPVTIERDRYSFESISHAGLYPCGEGAGHAGGITSAAVDGINCSMAILKKSGLLS